MTTSIICLPCYHRDCSSCKATMLALHPQLTTRGDFSSFCLRSTDRAQHYRGTISPQWRLPCFFMSSRNQCQHLRAPSSLPSSSIPPQDALPLSVVEEDEEDPLLKPVSVHIPFGTREIVLETGLIGRQASGSVTVTDGETVVYTTACAAEEPSEPSDFLPMTVRYHERFSAAGRTSGGFYKREGRAKDEEILVCRLIDRPLRPMIRKGFNFEIQILSWVFSYDGVHSPEALAITAAGAAMALSTIPLMKTVAAVRIGMVNGDLIVNPTISELESSRLDMILAGTTDAVIMIEGYCDFLAEEDLIRAISIGQDAVSRVCQGIEELVKKAGKPKMHGLLQLPPTIISYYIEKLVGDQLLNALQIKTKQARKEELSRLEQKVLTVLTSSNDELSHLIKVEEDLAYEEDEQIVEEGEVDQGDLHLKSVITKPERKLFDPVDVKVVFKETTSKFMRRLIVQSRRRSDGRGEKEIRRIQSLCGLLPRAHGSALFTRGETQALAVTTLGDDAMGQRMDNLTDTYTKRFYFQYTFPPSSVGETGYVGAPTRREIGHGMLAERALEPALPSEEEFPYTIRVESTITESNGSSSMASVCGGYLAMLDAGVPLKCSVAGVAMGLILDSTEWGGNGEPVILSDIIGAEDALGDMDFKVAGSYSGVTAFQMDIKVEGLSLDILGKALMQAKEARHHILEEMTKCRPPPSRSLSKYAILIETIKVEPEKVNILIGTGGKNVKHIIEQSGAENINFNDDGTVRISARSEKSIQCAKSMISAVAIEPMVGAIYRNCLVKSIVPFGCFVEIAPGREGLCHISELTTQRLSKPESFVKVGDRLDMKLIEINSKGQLRFSHRAILLGKAQQEAQGQTNGQEKEKEDTNKEIMQDDVNCSDREVKNEHRELSSASPDL